MPTGTPWLFLTEEGDSVEIEEVFDERASVVKLLPKLILVLVEKGILFCILFFVFVLFLFEVRVVLSTEEVGCVISMSLAIFVVVLLDEKREGEVETSKNERSPSSSCNCCNQTSASCCIELGINC